MKYKHFFKLFLLAIFLLSFSAFAQGNIQVTLETYLPDGGIMYLSDLGLTDVTHAPLLFALTIENTYPTQKDIVLNFGIRRGDEVLIDGETKPFPITAGAPGSPGRIYLTNQNIFAEGMDYSLQNIDITDATSGLTDAILATGKLPSGVYLFYVRIYNAQDHSLVAEDSKSLSFGAPTLLDLVSPGAPADRGEVPEIFTKMPFFQWDSDASKFEITVCGKLPSNTDPQDVMRNEPRLQRIVENQKFYQYPPDAWELVEGKTYFWQVVALIPSSGGETRLESEIWGFRVADMSGGSSSAEHRQLMSLLQSMFDSQTFAALFGEGGPLEGYQFTGSALLDGNTVSLQDLTNLLNDLLQGKIKIADFAIE
ncbi:MAG: hypothetical protein GXO74_04645 [Calditrichaeota bacterium]|nr:hypothetical protein [Calditrichota bacterium]